jgi:hypothetical protein
MSAGYEMRVVAEIMRQACVKNADACNDDDEALWEAVILEQFRQHAGELIELATQATALLAGAPYLVRIFICHWLLQRSYIRAPIGKDEFAIINRALARLAAEWAYARPAVDAATTGASPLQSPG